MKMFCKWLVMLVAAMFGTISPLLSQEKASETAVTTSPSSYQILIFGDTHFDSAQVRTPESFARKNEEAFRRNLECWQKLMLPMLQAAGKRSEKNIAFAVQLGDIIQGDCGNKTQQIKAYKTALGFITADLQVPLYLVRGNHDPSGPGGKTAYSEYMIPLIDKIFGTDGGGRTNHAFVFKNDLYIFFDCVQAQQSDVDFVRKTLEAHPDVRNTFFLTHFPLVPCHFYWPGWIIFGRPNKEKPRRELLELLAKRNVIVLAAHTHTTTLFKYKFPAGEITQFTSFSMPNKNNAAAAKEVVELDGSKFISQCRDNKHLKQYLPIRGDYEPYCVSFVKYTPNGSFNIMRVSDDGIFIDRFYDDENHAFQTLKIRQEASSAI